MTSWNEELVAKLEAERLHRVRPPAWVQKPPATPAEIAELVIEVSDYRDELDGRRRRRLKAV